MSHSTTVYNQLLNAVPRHVFRRLVESYEGDRYVKTFSCWQQFMVLLFAQIKGHDSLREITTSLNAQRSKHYHLGLHSVARSTLADANNKRSSEIFEGLFYQLLDRFRSCSPHGKFKFKNPLYALDSTVIDLCLSLFPWAKYRRTKGALKLHCLLDLRDNLPSFIAPSEGRVHDIRWAQNNELPLVPDSILVMDRGYLDFNYLKSLDDQGIYFVVRGKKRHHYEITGQHPIPHKKGLVSDQTVRLVAPLSIAKYPKELRLVCWYDEQANRKFRFFTNNFSLAASTIAEIYRARWQIETFFRWVKQNLKIKTFLGTSKNAVMTQIWVAMCYYLLLQYIRVQTRYRYPISNLARILRETLLERIYLLDLLAIPPGVATKRARDPTPQLILF